MKNNVITFGFTLIGMWFFGGSALAQGSSKIEIDCCFPQQVVRGQATQITVIGKNLPTLQSVEITPPQGITIKEIKEDEPKGNEKQQGKKRWLISIVADKNATPGERKVILVTPQGRSDEKSILIPSHIPNISNLTIISTASSDAKITLSFLVFDVAGDIDQSSWVTMMLACGGAGYIASSSGKITRQGPNKFKIAATLSSHGAHATGVCDMTLSIRDKAGSQSNELKTKVEFK